MTRPQPAKGMPERRDIAGRYVRLEPLSQRHAADLYTAATPADAAERFAYLPSVPPKSVADIAAWIDSQEKQADPVLYALVDTSSGRAGGWQQLMRIVPEHGVIEIGFVYWGPGVARTRLATEALYLHARYVFDELGYRRFEWKCNDLNEPSKAAARRFGFQYEGVFRQHMIVKGQSRDTAWFSMIDGEWPRLKAEYERWLDPSNFDANGIQKTQLRF